MPTQSEIARDWRTSRNYVHKCIHKKGCPTGSFEAARTWRDAYARGRQPTDRTQLKLLEEADGLPKAAPCPKQLLHTKCNQSRPSSDSLEHVLNCARLAEEEVAMLLREAIEEGPDSRIVVLLAIYNKALQGRLKAERFCREEVEYRRNLIPMDYVRTLTCNALNVIISNVFVIPQKVGAICNSEAPDHAIAVLETECANIISDIKKSCPKELSEGIL